jgi:hypothetical protein
MHVASTIMMAMKNLVKPNEWRLIKFKKNHDVGSESCNGQAVMGLH